ncbi:YadA C-terminal domain-containing protein [Geminisphaera colitermitum]|uniref:YadA C-terminal domain-containing protein n=1 Tax=Geminisphaera colitermitum TaxID=1148786 RepID=UPI0001965401|nr:YadA C-terminal domain-containing protein [Geminisphaera colitermitum]
MKYKIKRTHIRAILAAMATLSVSSWSIAATAPNSSDSFADSVAALTAIGTGSIPANIQAAIDQLGVIVGTAQNDLTAAQAAIATAQADFEAASAAGDATAAANALNARTAAENAASSAQAKIDLVNDAIFAPDTGAVATAQSNAAAAAQALTDATAGYAQGTKNPDGTPTAGLQNVIDSVNGLTSGDPSVQDGNAAVALATYAGSAQDLAAIAALANATADALNTLPPISDADKQTALDTVLNGSWEREAIKTNTTDISATNSAVTQNTADIAAEATTRADADIALQSNIDTEATRATGAEAALGVQISNEVATRESLIRQETDGSIHIGNNSLITNEVGGQQQLYAQDAGGNAIDIDVTNGSKLRQDGVLVATVDNVAAAVATETTRATARENQIEADSITRDNALGVRIDNEAATRTAADTQLQANIDATRADLHAEVVAETNRARTVETALDNRVTGVENRVSNLESRTAQNSRDIKTLRRGISMAAALQTPVIGEGKNNAAKLGVAYFDGETGLAAGYARRLNESVTVNAEIATTNDFDDVMARAGVNYTW